MPLTNEEKLIHRREQAKMKKQKERQRLIDLEAEVEKWKKIALASNDKCELEFNKHMDTQRLLDATKEGYDTMLSINKEAVKEIELLEIKNKRYIADAKEYKKQRDEYYTLWALSNHAHYCGCHPEEGFTLLDAYENGLLLEQVIEAYDRDDELRDAEDALRKRDKLPSFKEEWKEKFGADYPNVKDE